MNKQQRAAEVKGTRQYFKAHATVKPTAAAWDAFNSMSTEYIAGRVTHAEYVVARAALGDRVPN
jgi:hypothetical protein